MSYVWSLSNLVVTVVKIPASHVLPLCQLGIGGCKCLALVDHGIWDWKL